MILLPTVLSVAVSLVSSIFVTGASATVAGRDIFAQSHGFSGPTFADHQDSSTVKCGKHKIEVTAESIQIAGGRTIPIPPTCKEVKLASNQGKLTVYFDGVEAD